MVYVYTQDIVDRAMSGIIVRDVKALQRPFQPPHRDNVASRLYYIQLAKGGNHCAEFASLSVCNVNFT